MPKRKPQVKKYTLPEFKAWLEGIEEIQPDDWCPDLDQWKMIREKIAAIVEQAPRPVAPPRPAARPMNMPNNPPSALSPPPTAELVQPTPAGGMTPAAQAALAGKLPKGNIGGKLPGELSIDTAGSKTPNIDTRDGNYESNFT